MQQYLLKYWTSLRKPSQKNIWQGVASVVGVVVIVLVIRAHSPRPGTVAFTKAYAVSLVDYKGNTVHFDSFKQKPLVVFFWATWCPYCTAELTHLGMLKNQYGDKIEILAVNRGESRADAKAFTDALPLTQGIKFLLDPNDGLFKQLKGYAVPETIFVNSRGEEVLHQHGPLKPEEADSAIQKIL